MTRRTGRRRTLRGRVTRIGALAIALWLAVLTVGFDLYVHDRLGAQARTLLRTRAEAASTTLTFGSDGRVIVRDSSVDGSLDNGIWVFAGTAAIVRSPGDPDLQRAADALAGGPERFTHDEGGRSILFAQPVLRDGHGAATVVAAVSAAPYRRSAQAAYVGSAVLAVLVAAGAYAAVSVAARRALRPVETMTIQAGHWSAFVGSERFGEQRFAELHDLAGTLNGFLDRVSAVVRHERQLSGELSHELRTPLARIVAEVDLLLRRPHPPEQVRQSQETIRESALAMNRIIETLLAAARAELRPVPGTTSLGAVIDRVQRGHGDDERIRLLCADPDVLIGADEAVAERILWPIIDNARRFATHTIEIRARRGTAGDVLIDIVDDGPGIAVELRERVFEPGFTAGPAAGSAAGGDEHDGVGLGLALARRLARSADGDVTVADDGHALGGTILRVRLPSA